MMNAGARSLKDFEHTVVITTETEPNFTSGEAAFTPDEGFTWVPIPGASGYWAVAFANPHAGWFVGNNGQILVKDQLLIKPAGHFVRAPISATATSRPKTLAGD